MPRIVDNDDEASMSPDPLYPEEDTELVALDRDDYLLDENEAGLDDDASEPTVRDDRDDAYHDDSDASDVSGSESDYSEQSLAGEKDEFIRSGTVTSADTVYNAPKECPLVVEFPVSTLVTPQSTAINYVPPLPITQERYAVRELLDLANQAKRERKRGGLRLGSTEDDGDDDVDYTYIDLDAFEIYKKGKLEKDRLRPLHLLGAGKNNHNVLYFDGILSIGAKRFYVQRVPFEEAPVDMYGTDNVTVRGHISLRSRLNEKRQIYYRLCNPSPVYARFFTPYLWVADLGKHFIDYCDHMIAHKRNVRITHFRAHFAKWLHKVHRRSPVLKAWYAQYGREDFRQAVVAYGDYLWKEASTTLRRHKPASLGFFREIQFRFYEFQQMTHPPDEKVPQTVLTPYMFYCFSKLAISPYTKSVSGRGAPERLDNSTIMPQGRTPFWTGPVTPPARRSPGAVVNFFSDTVLEKIKNIRPGDVISTMPDDQTTDTKWPSDKDKYWYALVHRISETRGKTGRRHGRVFDVVWLYRPEDTPCHRSKYPWSKELFLSDHCTCDEEACHVLESQVKGVHSVEWFGKPETKAEFFVRQTYVHGERCWLQLAPAHIFCELSQEEARQSVFASGFGTGVGSGSGAKFASDAPDRKLDFAVHDTILATLGKTNTLSEPFEIDAFLDEVNAKGKVEKKIRLRKLPRRNEVDSLARDAPANELVYSQQFVTLDPESIIGRCLVRVFQLGTRIPTPYNRGGTGNAFFITHEETATPWSGQTSNLGVNENETNYGDVCYSEDDDACRYRPINDSEGLTLRQGFDPSVPCPRLRAMDLFCGCGNLGRGIEDSGVTETLWANDIETKQMHTFMANVSSPDAVVPFVGSADTLLERAIKGDYSRMIPGPGEVDFITGGSPCQGFSRLTSNKSHPIQFKNRSMVASFASFVDFYRPKYGILENVPSMVIKDKKERTSKDDIREDIFGQLISALLGLGYQLRIMLGNAWSYGAPQQRQRVFVLFAGPGMRLPDAPLPSHGSPPSARFQRALGRLSNGEEVTAVWDGPTAFPFVSAEEATADLQEGAGSIGDGMVDICVRYPDHRITLGMTDRLRHKIASIPTQPYGMNLVKSKSMMNEAVKSLFTATSLDNKVSRGYARIVPTRLFRTVRTQCQVADARSAGDIHWQDLRPLSVMEMRRAQGIPDNEVLLHSRPEDQWKLIGNAVSRQIALALGLAVREAWLGTLYDDHRGCGRPDVTASDGESKFPYKIKADSPHPPETTTTTTTLRTTTLMKKTTTTTTTSTAMNPVASKAPGSSSSHAREKKIPATFESVSSSQSTPTSVDLPFKQNRIFRTSVHKKTVISKSKQRKETTVTASVENVEARSVDQEPTKRSRPSSLVIDLTSKRLRRESDLSVEVVDWTEEEEYVLVE